jgi:hypothetical protein
MPFYWGKPRFSQNYRGLKRRWCGRVDSNHHGIATASPSSWCVCQFRHDRTEERDFIVAAGLETGKTRESQYQKMGQIQHVFAGPIAVLTTDYWTPATS